MIAHATLQRGRSGGIVMTGVLCTRPGAVHTLNAGASKRDFGGGRETASGPDVAARAGGGGLTGEQAGATMAPNSKEPAALETTAGPLSTP